jgi:fatty acid desaturase
MSDWYEGTTTTTTTERRPRRGFPDPFAMIIGLITLVLSAYALSDGAINLPADPRWLIAGVALFVGLMLLGASLRRR